MNWTRDYSVLFKIDFNITFTLYSETIEKKTFTKYFSSMMDIFVLEFK